MVEILIRYILPVLSFLIPLGIPFVYVIRTGDFLRGLFYTWLLLVLWYMILSVPVYAFLCQNEDYKELCIEALPEANIVIVALFFGWIYGIIISLLGLLVRKIIEKRNPTKLHNNDIESSKVINQ